MSDEQLSMADGEWEPGDGQAAPKRQFDTPPRPSRPSPTVGATHRGQTSSAFGERCDGCRRPFIPVLEDQRLCATHHIEWEIAQANHQKLIAGPDPAPPL